MIFDIQCIDFLILTHCFNFLATNYRHVETLIMLKGSGVNINEMLHVTEVRCRENQEDPLLSHQVHHVSRSYLPPDLTDGCGGCCCCSCAVTHIVHIFFHHELDFRYLQEHGHSGGMPAELNPQTDFLPTTTLPIWALHSVKIHV